MKTRAMWFVIDMILIGVILLCSLPASGQDLKSVLNSGGGFSLWIVVAIGVAAVLIAGMIIWHKRNPIGQAAAMAETQADLAKVLGQLRDVFASGVHKLDGAMTHADPPPPAGPTPEQIAAVQQAEAALAKAKSEAGLQ